MKNTAPRKVSVKTVGYTVGFLVAKTDFAAVVFSVLIINDYILNLQCFAELQHFSAWINDPRPYRSGLDPVQVVLNIFLPRFPYTFVFFVKED